MNFYTPQEIKIIMMLFFSMLISALFVACDAKAYIPNSQFVFDRTASAHGKGAYIIDQDVLFQDGPEKMVIKENWVILDGGEMRVSASSEGFRIFKILKRGRLHWVDANNSERADEATQDYFMTPLHIRTPVELKRHFVRWGVLPGDTLTTRRNSKDIKDLKEVKNDTESFVRLGRISGAVTYAYGKPTPINGSLFPGVWIEQDIFNIRKIRSPSGAEFYGNDFINYSRNLSYPRLQTISYNGKVVNIRVTRVQALDLKSDLKKQLEPQFLRGRNDVSAVFPKNEMGPKLLEFYKRFR